MNAVHVDGWRSLSIREIVGFGSGDSISVARLSDRSAATPIPVFGGNGIAGYTSTATISEPTVILGRVGQKCGVVYRNSGPAWITDNALYARRYKRPVDVRFLAFSLEAAHLNDVRNRNDLPLITQSILKDVKIAWPESIEEQRHIAEGLSDADKTVVALEGMIAKKRAIKQGMMQQYITGRVNVHWLSDVKWRERPLGQLLLRPPRYGINAAAVPLKPGLTTYIRITDISDSGRFVPDPGVGVSHPGAANYKLKPGELVLARTGASVGKSYLYDPRDGELVYAGFLINIASDPKVLNPEFLALYVQTKDYWDWVARTSVRSGQPGINGREYAQLSLNIPDIETQEAITRIFNDIDHDIDTLELRLAKVHDIKIGMMQQLLTGRTRLPV